MGVEPLRDDGPESDQNKDTNEKSAQKKLKKGHLAIQGISKKKKKGARGEKKEDAAEERDENRESPLSAEGPTCDVKPDRA